MVSIVFPNFVVSPDFHVFIVCLAFTDLWMLLVVMVVIVFIVFLLFHGLPGLPGFTGSPGVH